MRKASVLLLCLCLALPMMVWAQPGPAADRLIDLKHNAAVTGIMLPAAFDPYTDTYLLTVADWVSRITFTPTAAAGALITVNGQSVASGQTSQIIQMSNEPQAVSIAVSAGGSQTVYTVYLQRRPSERRTRVSAGYINAITMREGIATISADLVTIKYQPGGNMSNFYNDTVYMYTYECAENCLFYYGTLENPIRARTAQEFINLYLSGGNSLYYLIYIEDKIVAVLPYGAD